MFTNLMMIFAGLNETVPINPVSYLSVFWPVMHILYAASSPNRWLPATSECCLPRVAAPPVELSKPR